MPLGSHKPALEQLLSRVADASAGEAAAEACRILCEVLGVPLAFVSRLDGAEVEVVAVADPFGLGITMGDRLPARDSFCGRALAGVGPAVTDDLSQGPYADLPMRTALGVSSYAMVPLTIGDEEPFGTMCVLDRRALKLDAEDAQFMRLLAGLVVNEEELARARRLGTVSAETLTRREVELETSERRYRSLMDEIRDIVVRVGADGTIEFINQAWTTLTGVPAEDMIGKGCFDHVHPDDRDGAAAHLMASAAGVQLPPQESRFLSADGSWRWMSVDGRALFDDAGELVGFTGMLQDVTERRIAEERVRSALREAERARDEARDALGQVERASLAKTEFLSRMSHELRTPLNAVLGFGQLLELADLAGEDAEHVGYILSAGRHLLDLINEVLDVVRIESGHLAMSVEPVHVQATVAQSLALVQTAAAGRGLTVSTSVSPEFYVHADQQRLTQVLVNLLSNAVKYNSPGGRLSVDAQALPPEEHPGEDAGLGWLRIAISDTGLGIPAARLADAFTAFERLGAELTEIEGTGIGLSLSKTLAVAMGGHLGVRSAVGRGSTFYLDLPTAATPVDEPELDPEPGPERCTVLYIEDNRSNVKLMQRVLARRPEARMLVASDGLAGLELARRIKPDLILMDLHLPVLNGEEVLAALRSDAALAHTDVVIVTADLTSGTESRLLDAGASDFLSKPINIPRLLAVVDQHLPGHGEREREPSDAAHLGQPRNPRRNS